jgi:prephenate dehydrogenase
MFNKVRVVGSGLIGTSIALRLRSQGIELEMVDSDPKTAKLANDLVQGSEITQPDLIIISAPINQNLNLILQALEIDPKAIVIDIASVKSNLLDQVTELSENAQNFVSSHPMAGRELTGAQSARSDLFIGRAWIGIESDASSSAAKESLKDLADLCGSSLYWLTPKAHDEAVAAISHLPQIISSVLASSLNEKGGESVNLAGQGLRDVLRLAGSNPNLWSELLITNKSALQPFLSTLSKKLTNLAEAIEKGNQEEIQKILSDGNKIYNNIPGKHGGQNRDYAYLPIVIDDQPGQLAKIFNHCAEVNVNIEDLSIEHSPGQQTGLITLAINEKDVGLLANHLQAAGWNVHTPKSR